LDGSLKKNQQKRTARSRYFKTLKEPLILCEFLDIFDIFLGWSLGCGSFKFGVQQGFGTESKNHPTLI
jgi:hypothetical protein